MNTNAQTHTGKDFKDGKGLNRLFASVFRPACPPAGFRE
jgi:hypothetical protein